MAVRHPHARIDRRNAMAIGRCTMEWVRYSVLLHWNFLDARDSNRSMRKAPFSVDVHFFELRTPYTCDDEFREFIIDTYINFQLNNVFQRTYTYPNLYFWRGTERSLARIHPSHPILFFNVNGELFRIRIARAQDSRPALHDYYADH